MKTAIRARIDSKKDVLKPIAPVRSIERKKRIAIRSVDSTHFIRIDEIVHCIADNNYCVIHYGAGLRMMVAKTLKAVGSVLPASAFVRVHQSHIVRLDAIGRVYNDHLMLYTGESIPLSRSFKKDLLKHLADTATFL